MKILTMNLWPIQHWRIVLFMRLSWKIACYLGGKIPGLIRGLPDFARLVPELADILMESLQIRKRLQDLVTFLILAPFVSVWTLVVIIFTPWSTLAQWCRNLNHWAHTKPRQLALMHDLETAKTYQEWLKAANLLDELHGTDEWRRNPESNDYDHRDILIRIQRLKRALEQDDIPTIARIVRSGLIRNMVNIAEPPLYNKAFAGTKLLVEEYAEVLGAGVRHLTAMQTWPRYPSHPSGYDVQAQLDFLRTCRLGFGRSTLLLQGGAMFGFSHLGVAKALYREAVLPRVITGSGSGALAAALLCTRIDEDLVSLFKGEGIDLTAFSPARRVRRRKKSNYKEGKTGLEAFVKRLVFYLSDRCCCLNPDVLEECARDNFGNMTFEEAYRKTKRVLNITMPISRKWDRRNMFNYLQTPHVLIRSAVVASNVKYSPFSPFTVHCKDHTGNVVSYQEKASFDEWIVLNYEYRESPLYRLSTLFNVNHFIVSQARPFLLPLFFKTLHRPGDFPSRRQILFPSFFGWLRLEIRHRLDQMDTFGLIPMALYRLLLDEDYPNLNLVVQPQLSFLDYAKSLFNPTQDSIQQWILRGERGTWPAMSSIKVRSILEVELEKGYQVYQRKQDNSIADPYS